MTDLDRTSVEYTDDTLTFEGYLAAPPRLVAPTPCILLAHEWSGLNASMRRVADRFAGLGYPCFALDAYGKGVRGDERGDNTQLMAPLMNDRALLRRRLIAAWRAASRLTVVDASNLVIAGYCFGGLCALDLARAAPLGLKGCISFHGNLKPPNLAGQAKIHSRILLLHGWEDPVAPPADVVALAKELTDAGADWELHAYGHAQHGFTFRGVQMPERGIAHHPLADRRSWLAVEQFIAELLGAPRHGRATVNRS